MMHLGGLARIDGDLRFAYYQYEPFTAVNVVSQEVSSIRETFAIFSRPKLVFVRTETRERLSIPRRSIEIWCRLDREPKCGV